MHKLLLACLLAGAVHGAVVRGVVVENLTDRPLSRASVLLEPVSGAGAKRVSGHTSQFGVFELSGVVPGVYLLQASRVAFLTSLYGQKRWNSAGRPLVVVEQEMPFLTIRLRRYASITGKVVDENDVGIPEINVVAYLDHTPPQIAAKATSDEQGRYRIYGLLPGTYTVRTAGKQVDGAGYKPTYPKDTEVYDQARTVRVEIEDQVNEVNIRPLPGQLFSLSAGAVSTEPDKMPVTMYFASEMGREIIHGGDSVSRVFTGLTSGDYELYADAPTGSAQVQSDYVRLSLGRDSTAGLTLRKIPMVTFTFDGLPQPLSKEVKVLARRVDIAGVTEPITVKGASAPLGMGRWQFAATPPDDYYVSGFSGPAVAYTRRPPRADGWNEATVSARPSSNGVRFTFAKAPAKVRGVVRESGNPVVGAPVFLEPLDLEPEKRLAFASVAFTDIRGAYQFSGLAPGRYRILSSFEYQMPDSKIMREARADEFALDARADESRDLTLYVIK